jgi:hypothetical protein
MRPAGVFPSHRRPRTRALAAVAALLAAGVVVAGCGGGGSNSGVANVGTSTTSSSHNTASTSTGSGGGGTPLSGGPSSGSAGNGGGGPNFALRTGNPQQALKFSECMRANGVSNFPDPNGQGVIEGKGIDPNSPAWQRASKACAKDIGRAAPTPAQIAQNEAGALSLSKCMRAHGVTNFPDPQFGSGGAIRISIRAAPGSGGGLDPASPIFQKAQKACSSLLPALAGKTAAP